MSVQPGTTFVTINTTPEPPALPVGVKYLQKAQSRRPRPLLVISLLGLLALLALSGAKLYGRWSTQNDETQNGPKSQLEQPPGVINYILAAQALRAAQSRGIDLREATIANISTLIQSRTTSCSALTEYFLLQIYNVDDRGPTLHAFTTVLADQARTTAALLDLRFRVTGILAGSLHCVPVVVKDNTDVAGAPTTCGVQALAQSIPRTNAFVVDGLIDAGAVVLGKTNMPPFAAGGYSTNSETGGLCHNPYNRSATCFGSSGGSGAAVAAGLAVLGIGTDTCGSISAPAAGNDLVGLRGTWGSLLSLAGVVPATPVFDVIGPMARTALDVATAMDAITRTQAFTSAISTPITGLRVGMLETFLQPINSVVTTTLGPVWLQTHPAADIVAAVRAAGETLRTNAGCTVSSLNAPVTPDFLEVNFRSCADACGFQQMDVYFTDPDRFPSTDSTLYHSLNALIDSHRLSTTWQQSFEQRRSAFTPTACSECINDFWPRRTVVQSLLDGWLQQFDVLLYPAWLEPIPAADATEPPFIPGQPASVPACSVSAYSGFPSITFPVGFTQNNTFPIGAIALARRGREDLLLRLAHRFNLATGGSFRRSPVF